MSILDLVWGQKFTLKLPRIPVGQSISSISSNSSAPSSRHRHPPSLNCTTEINEPMMLSRRAASAATRALGPRALSLSLLSSPSPSSSSSSSSSPATFSPCRLYATEAAAPAAQPSPTPAPASKPPPAASKWIKAKTPAKPVPSATTNTLTAADVTYEPRTIAHQADGSQPPFDVTAMPTVDWASSFHGISSKPVTQEQFKVLMAPLPIKDIEVKPDGVIYLPEIKYRRRLNEVFGPMGWGMIPKGDAVVGNSIVTREYALIVDGRFVSQAQGENAYFSPDQLPSSVEGCKSNALMRCCKDLGIGSELWDPHFVRWFKKTHMEQAWVEHATTRKKKTFWFKKGEVQVSYPYSLTK